MILKIGNLSFINNSFIEVVKLIEESLQKKEKRLIFSMDFNSFPKVFTDNQLLTIYSKADLILIDGIMLKIILQTVFNKQIFKNTGCDLAIYLLKNGIVNTVSLLGTKKEILERAVERIENWGVEVVSAIDGFFEDEEAVVERLKESEADLLLVGMGFKKQELFLAKNFKHLPFKVGMGVGGTIDVIAGAVKRAPVIFRNLHLEWFYRLLIQPFRFGRIFSSVKKLPQAIKFLYEVEKCVLR